MAAGSGGNGGFRHVRLQHGLPAAVAVAYIALALLNGGYSLTIQAAGGVVVWAAAAVTAAIRARQRLSPPPAAAVAAAGLAAFALVVALSVLWSTDDGRVFGEAVRAAGYLGLFLLVVLSASGGGQGWLGGLALGLTAVGALAVASRMAPDAFPAQDAVPYLPSTRARLSYPLNYWNGLGAAMGTGVVLLAWVLGSAASRWWRALAAAGVPVVALALFLTSSRGGVASLVVGLVVLIAFARDRWALLAALIVPAALTAGLLVILQGDHSAFVDGTDGGSEGGAAALLTLAAVVLAGLLTAALDPLVRRVRLPRVVSAVALVAILAVAVVGAVAADPGARLDRFKRPPPAKPERSPRGLVTSHLASGSSSGRWQLWTSALDAFDSQSLRGVGAGGFEAWWAQHGSRYQSVRDAHSLYLETLGELGLLGFVCLAVFLIAPLVAALRSPRTLGTARRGALGVFAAVATSAAVDWSWELPAVFACAIVALGVLSAGEPAVEERPRGGLAWFLVTAVLAGVAIIGSALSYGEQRQLAQSRDAFRRGDLTEAANAAADAHALAPFAAAPSLQLALIEERRDAPRAAQEVARAVDRSPGDWRVQLVAARILTRAGDIRGGQAALRRAQALNPRFPPLQRR